MNNIVQLDSPTKKCSVCSEVKPIESFFKKKGCTFGVRGICKLCHQAETKKWKKTNPRKLFHYALKHYDLTIDAYNDLFNNQNGRCKTCGVHQTELKKKLCVDHNHATNRVRGLLCDACNVALGRVKENIETLQNMITYLKERS